MTGFNDKYWLFVADLESDVREDDRFSPLIERWNPGRDEARPQVYVGYTADSHPTVKFPDGDFTDSGTSILRDHGRSIRREDFCIGNRPGKLPMLRLVERTIAILRGKGWTVLNAPPSQDHHVYVFELEPEAAETKKAQRWNEKADPQMPCVYVGQSSLTPKERLERHRAGGRSSSPIVKHHFKRMLPALYEHLNPLSQCESLKKEEELARELRICGYTVLWG